MNKKIKNKSDININNNINIANFCNDNINNKKYKKYYDFLNNPQNIFITTQYMKFLYTETIKNKISKLIKENKNEIKKNLENAKIIIDFYDKNKEIQNSPIGKFFQYFKDKIIKVKLNDDEHLLKLFYELIEYPSLLSILKECFYIFSNYRACLYFMTPSINFRNCSKEQIDMYVKYFASNQNTLISLISKIYLGDKNSWGSPYYSTAIAMFETLNILGLHYETKNYNVLKKIKISANLKLIHKTKKNQIDSLLKRFDMNKINKKDNIKNENLFNVSQFIIILKKMGYDLWFVIPLIFDTLYKYDFIGIQESNIIGYKKIYHQKMNLKIGVMVYILALDGFITNMHIFNNFND